MFIYATQTCGYVISLLRRISAAYATVGGTSWTVRLSRCK